jgi:hypothetical protein
VSAFRYDAGWNQSVPRYHFVVHAQDHKHDDPLGTFLSGHEAAREHGHRIVRELKEGGYDPPGTILHVLDEHGQTIHSVPF